MPGRDDLLRRLGCLPRIDWRFRSWIFPWHGVPRQHVLPALGAAVAPEHTLELGDPRRRV